MEIQVPKTLSQQDKDFCELYVFGCDPYAGNARKCYQEIYHVSEVKALKYARELLLRDDICAYIDELRKVANYSAADMRARLTEKLLHIMDETSTASYTDRRGTPLSVAPLRSVAVQAAKALMEIHPIKVAQESKLELSGGDGNAGITFNVIVPQKQEDKE